MLMKSAVIVCNGRSTTKLDGAHSPPKPLDPNGRLVNANESVHYHHSSNGYSCHGRVEPVTVLDLGVTSADLNESCRTSNAYPIVTERAGIIGTGIKIHKTYN
jgi:hypothetical protein